MGQRNRLGGWVVPTVGGLLGLLVFHRYTIHSAFDLVQADPGDSRFVTFLLENWSLAARGDGAWRSPPIFYPLKHTLAYSDLLVGPALLYSLARLLITNPFVAFNVTVVVMSALAYGTAYWLLRRVVGASVPASVVGALFFAFCYPKEAQLVHAQLRFDFLLPVMFGLLWRLLADGGSQTGATVGRRITLIGLLLVVQTASSFYNGWFFALLLAVFLAFALLAAEPRARIRDLLSRHALPIGGSLAACGLLSLPLVAVYLPAMSGTGGRPWAEVSAFLPRPSDVVWQGAEPYLWGPLFRRFPERVIENWPEKRIGFGLVTTTLLIALSLRSLVGFASPSRVPAREPDGADERPLPARHLIRLGLWSAAALALLTVSWPSGASAWRWVYDWVPLASGVRAVPRLFLVLALPYSVAITWMVDRCTELARQAPDHFRRRLVYVATCAGIVFVLGEQCARTGRFSARQAFDFENRIAALVDRGCPSFYLMPTAAMRSPVIAEAQFDADKYLDANPDVAKGWTGSAWEHYQQFGRSEGRSLDPEAAHSQHMLVPHYHQTAGIVALLTGVPTLNGYSGVIPDGYRLSNGFVADIDRRIDDWVRRHGLACRPCVVEVPLTEDDIRFERPLGPVGG